MTPVLRDGYRRARLLTRAHARSFHAASIWLDATRRLTQSDLLRAARRYLDPSRRSVILVRPDLAKPGAEAAE